METECELIDSPNNIIHDDYLLSRRHGVNRIYRGELKKLDKFSSKNKCGLYFQNKKIVDISDNIQSFNKINLRLTIELQDPVKKDCKKPRVDWTDKFLQPLPQMQSCDHLNNGNKRKQKKKIKDKYKNEQNLSLKEESKKAGKRRKLPSSTNMSLKYSIHIPPHHPLLPSTKKLSRFRRRKWYMECNEEDVEKDVERDVKEDIQEDAYKGDQYFFYHYYWQLFRQGFRPRKSKEKPSHQFILTDHFDFPLIRDWYVGDKTVDLKESSEDVVNEKTDDEILLKYRYQDSGIADENTPSKIQDGYLHTQTLFEESP